jgi:hypothetical protein
VPCTNYQVVTDQVTVPAAPTTPYELEYRLTAPAGTQPLCGSFHDPNNASVGSYPDGDDWVFLFYAVSDPRPVDLYLVCGWV